MPHTASETKDIVSTVLRALNYERAPVYFDGSLAVPSTLDLPIGWWTIKYNAGGTAVLYVNDAGTIKSLSLGTPA